MPAGRPVEYKSEYCDAVIEYGSQGKSLAWMAAELGVHRDSLHEWTRVYPEFSDALGLAKLKSQQWWEDVGQNHITSSQGSATINAGVWSRSMAARFPEDWREKSEVKHEGGLTIQVSPTENDL